MAMLDIVHNVSACKIRACPLSSRLRGAVEVDMLKVVGTEEAPYRHAVLEKLDRRPKRRDRYRATGRDGLYLHGSLREWEC